MAHPHVIVLAGPNGSGKSTAAPRLLRDELQVTEFVNADVIAQGLSAFDPDSAAFEAGRLMLNRLSELAEARADFAFETTLASRTFAPWLKRLISSGYEAHLLYVWVSTPDLNVSRVAARVRAGGHYVPEDTVRRRYERSVSNFFNLYRQIDIRWRFYDNTQGEASVVAEGVGMQAHSIVDIALWNRIERQYGHGTREARSDI